MKLDSRILKGKTYLDCYDTEIAKKFIGKECYLSDGVASFSNIDNLNKATLLEVDDEDVHPYKLENTRWRYGSFFILPCEWVKKPEEKMYRPFSLNEFLNRYRLGNTVYFRRIGYKEVKCAMFVEYVRGESPEENQIVLGNMRYTLAYLFKNHELSLEDIWQPFGVVDE